jgi:alpha-D-ribose 1-methylphosphonate 5-triphosphate synthase subunit PhnI
MSWRLLVFLSALLCLPLTLRAKEPEAQHVTESLRGKVLWTADVLKERFGIESDSDSAQTSVSLVTREGKVYPIVKDVRGRGFMKDDRLRNREMELLVRRYEGSPFIQVIRVYTIKEGRKYALDYWCDICAIIMYEEQECECCKGPIRLREELVTEGSEP